MAKSETPASVPLATLFADLKGIVDGIAGDVVKSSNGVSAAGTRVRKAMLELKKKAQDIRVAISESKSSK